MNNQVFLEMLESLRGIRAVLSSFDDRNIPRRADPAWDQVPIALEVARVAIEKATTKLAELEEK